jgi:hypothetical protein
MPRRAKRPIAEQYHSAANQQSVSLLSVVLMVVLHVTALGQDDPSGRSALGAIGAFLSQIEHADH